jgi:hypothetical protein
LTQFIEYSRFGRFRKTLPTTVLIIAIGGFLNAKAALLTDLQRLQTAYPDHMQQVTEKYLVWTDGSRIPTQDNNPNKTIAQKLVVNIGLSYFREGSAVFH